MIMMMMKNGYTLITDHLSLLTLLAFYSLNSNGSVSALNRRVEILLSAIVFQPDSIIWPTLDYMNLCLN